MNKINIIIEKLSSLKKYRIVLLLAGLMTVASTVVWSMNPASRKGPFGFGDPAPMVKHQMRDGSFSILYPENWSVFETPGGSHGDEEIVATVVVAGKFSGYVNIARQSFPQVAKDKYLEWGESRASENQNYKSVSVTELSNLNVSGFVHEYVWSSPDFGGKMIGNRCQDIYTFTSDFAYDLSFCALEKDWLSLKEYFSDMQRSFTVSP